MTQVCNDRPRTPRQAAKQRIPLDALLDPELFKALSDPTRVTLLRCLMKCGRPCSVSEVAECCSVDFSVVSRHLQVLERAELLIAAKKGRVVSYRVDFEGLSRTFQALAVAVQECCPTEEPSACCDKEACRRTQ